MKWWTNNESVSNGGKIVNLLYFFLAISHSRLEVGHSTTGSSSVAVSDGCNRPAWVRTKCGRTQRTLPTWRESPRSRSWKSSAVLSGTTATVRKKMYLSQIQMKNRAKNNFFKSLTGLQKDNLRVRWGRRRIYLFQIRMKTRAKNNFFKSLTGLQKDNLRVKSLTGL